MMTDKEKAYFDGFSINEGAYFYRKNFEIDENEIKRIFTTIKENAHSHTNIVEIIKEPVFLPTGNSAICSLKIFQNKTVPPFIKEVRLDLQKRENIICYFLLIEIRNFLVLFTRHANGLSSFKNKHTPITSNHLAGALVTDSTIFTQMRMGNMNLNQFALRNKSYESDDLSQSMPTYGSSRQILKTARIQNENETIALGFSTSRISKIGSERKTIVSLCRWAEGIINGFENPYDVMQSLMGHFSTPVKWKDFKNTLVPSYLLIDFYELENLIQNNHLIIQYKKNDEAFLIESSNFFTHMYRAFNGCKTVVEKNAHKEYVCEDSWGLLEVVLQKTGIRLRGSGRLDNLYLVDEGGHSKKLITYINLYKCFYVGFEDFQFIYHGNQLHKDGNIFDSVESLLSIFSGILEMNVVSSEKGLPKLSDVDFADDTVFHVVEQTFRNEGASHIICDDMGFECADHIVLSKNKISFVHSKAKGRVGLSASSFQEVIGQALKNIGNIRYMNVAEKIRNWRGSKFHGSNIDVCREGDLDTFEDTYKEILNAPNGIKEVCIAVDFISKMELRNAFNALKEGRSFRHKHAVSQMIWLLSAFISSCKDADLQCRIFCRE